MKRAFVRLPVLIVGVLGLMPFASARQQSPSRDAAAAVVATGTASIAGRIVADDATRAPIGRAVVTLSGPAVRPGQVIVADDAGRFKFTSLPAGPFTVTASRSPYLSTSYGQKTPGRGYGVPISLDAGQQITDIVLAMARGAVISGRVLDARGQPMRGAPILIQRSRTVSGQRVFSTETTSTTDAQGLYRAFGLAPGAHYVCAFPPGDFRILIPDLYRPPASELRQADGLEMQWALQQLHEAGRGAAGAPGAASPSPAAAEPPLGPPVAYGPVYYPNTSDPSAAAAVTVGTGEERTGVDLVSPLQPTASIDGRVLGPDGQPAADVSVSIQIGSSTAGSRSPDGRFAVTNLLPGKIGITAQASGATLWASTEVVVNGKNVSGLVLTLQPAVTMAGRVVFEGTAIQAPADVSALRLSLRPAQGLPLTIPVRADGTFQLSTLMPGRYRLGPALLSNALASAGAGAVLWTMKSTTVTGRDVTDVTFDVGAGGVSDVVVTFTDRTTELSGRLVNAAGRAVPAYYITLFATDKSMWRQSVRQLPSPVRSATDGQFQFKNLLAGTYYIAAIPEFDPADLVDEEFLTQLIPSAIKVTLAEGEKKVQELRIKGGG